MPTKDIGARNPTPPQLKNLVCSSGGSRAILGSAGAIVAIDHAGIKDLDTIGGVSGGSVTTALFAGGYDAKTTLKLAIDIDFSSKLTRHGSILRVLVAYFMKGRFERTRPRKGVLSSEKLGTYIDSMVPVWPKGYWTMAVVGDNQMLFTEKGVFEITPDGQVTVISSKPAPL
ncbi:MAG TPA: patatin-like phospholipase family protein, partial [Chroococcales cyanobacterium]